MITTKVVAAVLIVFLLSPGASTSPYGGDPADQAGFIRRFAEPTRSLDFRLALWAFPFDLGSADPAVFQSIGLRQGNGVPKPALAAWIEIAIP